MKPSALVVDLKEPLLAPTRDKRRECRARLLAVLLFIAATVTVSALALLE